MPELAEGGPSELMHAVAEGAEAAEIGVWSKAGWSVSVLVEHSVSDDSFPESVDVSFSSVGASFSSTIKAFTFDTWLVSRFQRFSGKNMPRFLPFNVLI